jgi:formyl-CoA transferase
MQRAFEGVRILAVEHMLAMPYATQLLAFMGAEVVKVEPPGGEAGRKSRPKLNGDDDEQHGAVFFRANLGKRSVAINLKTDDGRDVFLRMVPHFDIVAENMRPGVLASMNLNFDVLRQAKPDIILATLSGFGHLNGSPYYSWPAYAPIIEASGGLYTIGRDPDDPLPTGSLAALADVTGGIFAALAMSSALRRRDMSGEAQHVDVSMLDASMVLNDAGPLLHSMGVSPEYLTGRRVGLLESFNASNGRFAVTIMREHMFQRFAKVIGHPDWVEEERFARREPPRRERVGGRPHQARVRQGTRRGWSGGRADQRRVRHRCGRTRTPPPHAARRGRRRLRTTVEGLRQPRQIRRRRAADRHDGPRPRQPHC